MNRIVSNPPFASEEGDGEVIVPKKEESTEELETEQSEEETTESDEETESSSESGEATEGEESEESESESESEEQPPQKIKIGEFEYSPEELQEIVTKGSKVKEWEQKMPGFDVDKFMPDYTRKSQRLAQYEKAPQVARPVQKTKEELEALGVDDEQIKIFENVAKHLGFVKQTDLVQTSVESQKESFLASHPEYAPGDVANDQRWATLMQEFNLFNWEAHPHRVEEFLEEAHKRIAGTQAPPVDTKKGQEMKQIITTKKAQAAIMGVGGGVSKSRTTTQAPSKGATAQALIEKYRAAGWSEEDIKDILT